MLHIHEITHPNTALFLEQAIRTAEYYGFTNFDNAPACTEPAVSGRRKRINQNTVNLTRREERALVPVVHAFVQKGLGDARQPSFLWREGAIIRADGKRYSTLELHVLGIPSAIAEALLIAITNAIAEEAGVEERTVCLNSLGSTDSSARYARDLGNYLRKYFADMPSALRPLVHKNPIDVLAQLIERGDPLADRAPNSLEYLNEEERRHFWDVLEYLEVCGLYYELTPRILGSRDCWTHTLFEVNRNVGDDGMIPFARGGRYDTLAGHCVGAGAAAVSVSIACEMHGRTTPKKSARAPRVDIYFAHLGSEAKRHSLPVLEQLRRAGIATHQSLAHEHIADQMVTAKKLRVPYVLIMGHKEATEGTVLVRETKTNSQEPVPVETLTGYLKRRRIAHMS